MFKLLEEVENGADVWKRSTAIELRALAAGGVVQITPPMGGAGPKRGQVFYFGCILTKLGKRILSEYRSRLEADYPYQGKPTPGEVWPFQKAFIKTLSSRRRDIQKRWQEPRADGPMCDILSALKSGCQNSMEPAKVRHPKLKPVKA